MTERKLHVDHGETTCSRNWCEEKSRPKCLKEPIKTQRLSGALDGRRWRFLVPGQDDFRNGYPPTHTETFTQPRSSTAPATFGLYTPAGPSRVNKKRLSKEQTCFSKQNCLRHARRQHVDAVEERLKAHALALYPHLESGMTPEGQSPRSNLRLTVLLRDPTVVVPKLFDDVLSVLDPDILVKREQTGEDVRPCGGLNPESSEDPTNPSESRQFKKEQLKGPKSRNPYKWCETKMGAKDDKMVGATLPVDEGVIKVTKLLCDWVTSLGGETNDLLTESSILSLFAGSSEEKSALPVPNEVQDPHQITEEVWRSIKSERKGCSFSKQLKNSERNKVYRFSVMSETWRKRSANESRRDCMKSEDLEIMQQPSEKDAELKLSHGTQAFKQYIVSKGLRMPQFLSSVFSEEEGGEQDQRDRTGSAKNGTVI